MRDEVEVVAWRDVAIEARLLLELEVRALHGLVDVDEGTEHGICHGGAHVFLVKFEIDVLGEMRANLIKCSREKSEIGEYRINTVLSGYMELI